MYKRYSHGLPWPVPHEAMRFAGFRAMQELAERQPERYMDGALGMYYFSHAMWLAEEMRRGGFERLIFLARDGYYIKQAFERVRDATGLQVETDYVRVSRQAVFPLHFRTPDDLANIADWVNVTAHTPQTLTALLEPVLKGDVRAAAEENGLCWTERITASSLPDFIRTCRQMWDAASADAYRSHAAAYFTPRFTGRCATFDVGYNLRSESVIRDLTGGDITAFITHTDSDVPDRRGVPYRTLYSQSPYVSWVAREQFLLEDAPVCVGYDADGPVLTRAHTQPAEAVRMIQKAAMKFVEDMIDDHGPELLNMPFRPADGCAPFEWFLHRARRRDMLPFRQSLVENDFHAGAVGEDDAFLQWRLMQTDFRAAVLGEPPLVNKLRRAIIRVREEPRSVLQKLRRR